MEKKDRIYLDNGATTMLASEVLEEMFPYFQTEYGNANSLHSYGRTARGAVENARKTIAQTINAQPEEIIFTSGGTESNNFAIKGIALANKDRGNHIIVSSVEHECVLKSAEWLERRGFKVTRMPVNKFGVVEPDVLKRAITPKTTIVSIMHANNEIGSIFPIMEYAEICRKMGVYFHTDACQSYTKVPIDVKKMNVDAISINSHKIHGPKGVGAIFIRKGTKIEPFMDGGGQEFRLRSGTENVPGIVGFAKAATLIQKEDVIRMEKLRDALISDLLKIPNTHINGAVGKDRLCNNISVSFNFIEGESLVTLLDIEGVSVSTGSACSSSSLEPSHVLLAIGLRHEIAHGTIRITLSKYTTSDEISYATKKIKEAVEKLRKISPLANIKQSSKNKLQ
ncbi:MAG: cysteine desulfurase family protein [Candidatus Woesearchaeota archaeon]